MIRSALTCAVCTAVAMAVPGAAPVAAGAMCAELAKAAAGNAFYDALKPLTESLHSLFGRGALPGDPVLAALRGAHLDALDSVVAAFETTREGLVGDARDEAAVFAYQVNDYVAMARAARGPGLAERAKLWVGLAPQATAAALFAPLPGVLTQTLAGGAAQADLDRAMLAEVLELAGIEERSERFEAVFLHPETGWLARFAANARRALADTPAFATLWNAAQQAQIVGALAGLHREVKQGFDASAARDAELLAVQKQILATVARDKGVDPADLAPILANLGHTDVPLAEIPKTLAAAVDRLRAQGRQVAEVHNDAPLIDRAIAEARALLSAAKAAEAVAVIDAALAADDSYARALAAEAEAAAHRAAMGRGRARALFERAKIQRTTFDYAGARASLGAGLALDADAVARWIDLGDICVTTGDTGAARDAFAEARAAAERQLAQAPDDLDRQRDLSVCHNWIGDVQRASGDLAAALGSYRAGLEIAARLAAQDPGNAVWQRDLGISHERIGDVQRDSGDLAAALGSYRARQDIAARLADQDPGNAEWQRDLGISHNKIGDVQRASGDLAAALGSYRTGQDIFARLAAQDPGNAAWQRDLSVSHSKLGVYYVATDHYSEAVCSFGEALKLSEILALRDPKNVLWQFDVAEYCAEIAKLDPAKAHAMWARALGIGRAMRAEGKLTAEQLAMLSEWETLAPKG